MNITLHIDRLIIDEALLTRGNVDALGAAVQSELARLLATGADGNPVNWLAAALPSLSAGAIQLAPNADASDIGTQIATNLATSLATSLAASLAASTSAGVGAARPRTDSMLAQEKTG